VKQRILVVEDDPKVLSALTRGLALEGYEVDSAEDGPGALALAAARPPDVAVLDVMLPGMSGLEVCDRLRRDGVRVAPFPILFLTAPRLFRRTAGAARQTEQQHHR